MSTNSSISVELEDGTVRQVYCNWDGYLSWNGHILLNHYNSPELAELVTSGGEISSLRPRYVPEEGVEHSFSKPAAATTILYTRDRGEELVVNTYKNLTMYKLSVKKVPYKYLFRKGAWYVTKGTGTKATYNKITQAMIMKAKD